MTGTVLVGDIGGTNARFALAAKDAVGYENELTLRCSDFSSPEDAIAHYLTATGAAAPGIVCLAVAGPVVGGVVEFTNSHWRVDEAHLRSSLHLGAARLLNDFAAISLAVPVLSAQHLLGVGVQQRSTDPGQELPDNYCVGVMGPGTGLGASGLSCREGDIRVLITEAGHAAFAPADDLQLELFRILQARFGRVSSERLISGPGVENIYSALAEAQGMDAIRRSVGDIFDAAVAGTDPLASETVDLFFTIFGQVAGDFVLSIGAFDGLYLAGGVIQRYGALLQASGFRAAFEDKGRLGPQLAATPSLLITHPQPGLLGASELGRTL